MKRISLILFIAVLLFCFTTNTKAQDCSSGYSLTTLDVNNVKAYLPMGNLWINANNGGYIFPNTQDDTPEIAAMFAGGFWFGGVDPAGNLKLSATTYGPVSGESAYWPGPLDPATGETDAETCSNWDIHFSVHSENLEPFLEDLEDGTIDDPIHPSLLVWPGRGNPHFFSWVGFELPNTSQGLAPFWDENQDGIYNPEDGDYPAIKGADQAVWWVFNTTGGVSNSPASTSTELEIQMMAYAYASSNTHLNNTTFYEMSFINRGQETLDSMFTSLWVDPDLGCYTDDYVGCLSQENMMFIYNEDAVDGSPACTCPQGVSTYCEEPPLVGIKFFQRPLAPRIFDENGDLIIPPIGATPDTLVEQDLSSFMTYLNGGVGSPPLHITDPTTAIEYYRYMNGRYRDDSPVVYNGEAVSHLYNGNPSAEDEWSMCTDPFGPSDIRTLSSFGPLWMPPGAINKLSFFVTALEDVEGPCPDMTPLVDAMNEVESIWNGGSISTNEISYNSEKIKVFPNPMQEQVVFQLNDDTDRIKEIKLFNVSGQLQHTFQLLNERHLELSGDAIASGIYFYQIFTSKNQLYTGKLIAH